MPKIIEPCAPTARRTEDGRELRKQGIEAFNFKSLAPRVHKPVAVQLSLF